MLGVIVVCCREWERRHVWLIFEEIFLSDCQYVACCVCNACLAIFSTGCGPLLFMYFVSAPACFGG